MPELPKFVLQRLSATAAPEQHPSADLLAAFAEQQLRGAERERLITHLADCRQCREIIWRALPEEEAAASAAAGGVRTRAWFWAPAWRWASAAAGVIVIATVALIFQGGRHPAEEKIAAAPAPVIAQKSDTEALAAKEAPAVPPKTRLEAKAVPPQNALARRHKAVSSNELAAKDELDAKRMPASSADSVALNAPARAVGARAAAAPAATAAAGVMIASNIAAQSIGKKKLAPPTRWMLSADGALLRSTDAGKNWQIVPFQGKVVFRAMAVVGPRIWVGGQDGVLYYSPDDGSQWLKLAPSAEGVRPTEDIKSLVFQDSQHGSLTTATGQTWTTSDAGQSWQKQ